ncbi:hypothetical protein ASPCAL13577 [Aspergillus calidoustus]|uniref:Ecp2 effector protein domain-containing protein n=1 Tax=Aspergillus calidoustus TaxID=454130 RepID=A0A0U5CHY6_ASPCI|nr:hypothetical protein ASPCAL13577 [Aspergillus calidoustus]
MQISQLWIVLTAFALVACALPTTNEIPTTKAGAIRVGTVTKLPGKPIETRLIHDELESRAVKHNVDCTNGSWTKTSLIRDGVEELRLKAASNMRPYLGSKKCATVACERGAAIMWCNDNDYERLLPSWHNVADGAQVILNECSMHSGDVRGTLDHNDHWRVLVGLGKC